MEKQFKILIDTDGNKYKVTEYEPILPETGWIYNESKEILLYKNTGYIFGIEDGEWVKMRKWLGITTGYRPATIKEVDYMLRKYVTEVLGVKEGSWKMTPTSVRIDGVERLDFNTGEWIESKPELPRTWERIVTIENGFYISSCTPGGIVAPFTGNKCDNTLTDFDTEKQAKSALAYLKLKRLCFTWNNLSGVSDNHKKPFKILKFDRENKICVKQTNSHHPFSFAHLELAQEFMIEFKGLLEDYYAV